METVKQLIEKLKELPEDARIFNEEGVECSLDFNLLAQGADKKIIGIILRTKVDPEMERLLSED